MIRQAARHVVQSIAPRYMERRAWRYREIDARPDLHDFWRQAAPEGNEPEAYFEPVGRSAALTSLLSHLKRDAKILEVGCNVGRNLAYLHDAGLHDVSGIEISDHAVALLREGYPQLAAAEVHVGAAEDVLPRMADEQFDVVFTMAVLEHIHPDSKEIFDGIARVGREVLAIEPAHGTSSHRQYPHDISALFLRRGLFLVEEVPMEAYRELLGDDTGLDGYTARRFRRS